MSLNIDRDIINRINIYSNNNNNKFRLQKYYINIYIYEFKSISYQQKYIILLN